MNKELTIEFCTKCDETEFYKNCSFCSKKSKVSLGDDLDNIICQSCRDKFPKLAGLELVESISDCETESHFLDD